MTTVYMPTPCWLKHLCSIRTPVPVSLFLFLSLSLSVFLWSGEALWVHVPAQAPKTLSKSRSASSPHQEGTWGLCEQSRPPAGALLAFCINQGKSPSFSPLLSYRRLWTTRFWSIKGPQQKALNSLSVIQETALEKHLLWEFGGGHWIFIFLCL